MGAPKVKEHTMYVQYTLEGLRTLTKLGKSPENTLWHGCCIYGIMGMIL
jgi:hypothetical protein